MRSLCRHGAHVSRTDIRENVLKRAVHEIGRLAAAPKPSSWT